MVGFLLAAIGVFAVVVAWCAWIEPRMIYYPQPELTETPGSREWAFEEVWLTSSDGVRIHGWFIPSPAPPRASRVTVLFFHGNAGNIGHRLEKIAILRSLGADVLIVDYRGYGRSEGRPSEAGLYRDARAAYDFLAQVRKVDPAAIVLYSESLGTAVATRLASQVAVGKMVLEAPFTSIVDVGRSIYPFLPVGLMVRNRFDTLRDIPRVQAPILVLHSRDDEIFPLRHAQRLVAAATPHARLVVMRGGHNDAFLVSAALYREALAEFIGAREGS